ncbi:hypothetical protein BC941DRAFT_462457 [Chlamydoabsidia padenii]|nr:hypothetical protein BC941DRAFT_462457 [Chlamydoabsidia padenii]
MLVPVINPRTVKVVPLSMIPSRSLSLTQARTKATLKTLDSSLQRYNPVSGETYSISSRCADMDGLLPIHLGVPKAILENVIFCHQEESNWPLSEPSILKKKFDDIFASTKYTKALESIKDIKKDSVQETKINAFRLDTLKNDTVKAQRLQADVAEMEQQCDEKQARIESLDQHIHDTTAEIERLLEVHQQAQILSNKIAQASQQKELYRTNLAELEKDLTARDESDEELEALLQAQSTKNAADEGARQTLVKELSGLEQQLQVARDNVSAKLTQMGRLQAASDANDKNIEEQDQLIRDICNEFNLKQSPQTKISDYILAIKEVVSKREQETQHIKTLGQGEQDQLSDEIQSLKSERVSLEEAKKHTQRELDKDKDTLRVLTSQLDNIRVTQVDIDMEKDRLSKEEALLKSHQSEMNSNNMDTAIATKERQLRELDDEISNLNDEMSKLSLQGDTRARLALKRGDRDSKLAAARSIFEQCKEDVTQGLGIEPTLERLDKDLRTLLEQQMMKLSTIQHQLDQANRNVSAAEALLSLTQTSITDKRKEADSLEQTIQQVCLGASLPDEIKKLEGGIEKVRNSMSTLDAVNQLYSRFIRRAQNDEHCPLCIRKFAEDSELTQFIEKLESTINGIPKKRIDYTGKIEQMEQKQELLRSLENSWVKMENLRTKDIPALEKKAKEHEQKQDHAIEQMGKVAAEMSQAQEEKSRIERIYKLSENAVRQHQESKQLDKDISQLESELRQTGSTRTITDCKRELEDLADRRATPIDSKIDHTVKELQECRERWSTKLNQVELLANNGRRSKEKLDTLNKKIEMYERSNVPSQLAALSDEKKQLDSHIKTLNERQEAKNNDIRIMDKELADRQGVERELKDHIRYRSIKKQLKSCELELAKYQQQSQRYEKATYEQQLEQLKNKQTRYIGTRGGLQGEIRQMRDQLNRYKHDLDTDYKDIQERYGKQFIQVNSKEIAVNDLENYTKALQQAIMRYHSLKMEDLNKIIKELWMSTYRGGDIDYIEIRSDAEGTTAANRSYNYRVVMMKDGREMNLRGRCSAGQKVLTSIIIRLALAETFCIHCGVLTLDEPTTNLDRGNIESLADNLARIIQSRRAQSNFQLVVITHDEEFVDYLSKSAVYEKYYRISKDEK